MQVVQVLAHIVLLSNRATVARSLKEGPHQRPDSRSEKAHSFDMSVMNTAVAVVHRTVVSMRQRYTIEAQELMAEMAMQRRKRV